MYEINSKESQTINYLRAVFIILVIYIHTWVYTSKGYVNFGDGNLNLDTPVWLWNFEYTFSVIIARCATPGFFLLSSLLLFRKDFHYRDNILKRVRTLCIPWFIVTTFWILFYAIVQRIPAVAPFFSNEKTIIANWSVFNYIDAYLGITGDPLVYPLWFLQNLLFLNIISKPIKYIIDHIPWIFLFLLLALYLSPLEQLLFCLQKAGLFWFCIGYYLVKYNIRIKDIEKLKAIPLTIAYICIITASLLFMKSSFYYILDEISITVGILWFTKVLYSINESSLLAVIGHYSFLIYITHELTLRIFLKAYTRILGSSLPVQILEYFIVPLIIVSYCLIIGFVLSKKMPKLYAIIVGNRK